MGRIALRACSFRCGRGAGAATHRCGVGAPRPPESAARLGVTVVIPVKERADLLGNCLRSLGGDRPIVVVDDGSLDREALADIAAAHSAALIRRPRCGGPAAARNTGLAAVDTDLVAFLDSDCITTPDWLDKLLPHFADPLVAAVAPRIVAIAGQTSAGRYGEVAGSLDMGAVEGRVVPGSRIAYVPSAALVVRRNVLRDIGEFDERLRYGEDVDLIWRLHEAGLRIRYEPAARVYHREPRTWPELLARRFHYGTSAAPLAQRHPSASAPLIVHRWHSATVLAALSGHPGVAALTFGLSMSQTRRTLRRVGLPTTDALTHTTRGLWQTWLGLGRFMIQFTGPLLVLLLAHRGSSPRRRTRRVSAAVLLLSTPVTAYFRTRPRLDPFRFALGQLTDHIAYGAGVWAGCLRHRTAAPINPQLARRPRRISGAATGSAAAPSSSKGPQ